MYKSQVNLKFKKFMIQMRKEENLTQAQVAEGLGMTRSQYMRLEGIGHNTAVTLEQTVDIFNFYKLAAYDRLLSFVDPINRTIYQERITSTRKLLDSILGGKIYWADCQTEAWSIKFDRPPAGKKAHW